MGRSKKSRSLACKRLGNLAELRCDQLRHLARVLRVTPQRGNRPIPKMRKAELVKTIRSTVQRGTFPENMLKFSACLHTALGEDVPDSVWTTLGEIGEGEIQSCKNYIARMPL